MIFLELFGYFFLIGLFTFGGGYGMIPIIKDVVVKKGWLDNEAFTQMIGLSEITPGPIAINMATYVGNLQGRAAFDGNIWAGFLGSFLATLGVILPAFLIMLLVAWLLQKIVSHYMVQGVLNGIKPVAVGLILATGIILFLDNIFPVSVGGTTYHDRMLNPMTLLILFLTIIATLIIKKGYNRKVSPIAIILVSAIIGLVVNVTIPL